MATATALPGMPPEHRGLTHWMQRVPKELDALQSAPDKDAVHDLRVAIRRCRSVASVMREVDPDPAWREMRRLPRKLFRKLGELRDTQIMDEWVAEHGDPRRIDLWVELITGMEVEESYESRLLDVEQWQARRRLLSELGGPPTHGE